jgi:hypothetical protein
VNVFRRPFKYLFVLPFLFVAFQNCDSPVKFQELTRRSDGPGNADGYEGKRTLVAAPAGTYDSTSKPAPDCRFALIDDARVCASAGADQYQVAIDLFSGAAPKLYSDTCAGRFTPLASSEIETSMYNPDLAGYGDGIYQCLRSPGLITARNLWWCRAEGATSLEGMDLVIRRSPGAPAPAVDLDLSGPTLPASVAFSRADAAAGIASYLGADAIIHYAGQGQPRFENGGLLIEEARRNLLPRSHRLESAEWVPYSVTVQADQAAAPDGRVAADRVTTKPEDAEHVVRSNFAAAAGVTYTMSIYVKAETTKIVRFEVGGDLSIWGGTPAAIFDLDKRGVLENSAADARISPAPNGFYRISVTQTTQAGGDAYFRIYLQESGTASFLPSSPGSLLLWGAQAEAGARAGSYIATDGTPVTRPADMASVALAGFPSDQGSFLIGFSAERAANSPAVAAFADGSGGETAAMWIDGQGRLAARRGLLNVLSSETAFAERTASVAALSYGASLILARDSGVIGSAPGAQAAAAPVSLLLGRNAAGTSYLNGSIAKVRAGRSYLNEYQIAGFSGDGGNEITTGELWFAQAGGGVRYESMRVAPFQALIGGNGFGSREFNFRAQLSGGKGGDGRWPAKLDTQIDGKKITASLRCRIQE